MLVCARAGGHHRTGRLGYCTDCSDQPHSVASCIYWGGCSVKRSARPGEDFCKNSHANFSEQTCHLMPLGLTFSHRCHSFFQKKRSLGAIQNKKAYIRHSWQSRAQMPPQICSPTQWSHSIIGRDTCCPHKRPACQANYRDTYSHNYSISALSGKFSPRRPAKLPAGPAKPCCAVYDCNRLRTKLVSRSTGFISLLLWVSTPA